MPDINHAIVSDQERATARTALEALEKHGAGEKTHLRMLLTEAGREITLLDLPPSVVPLIRSLLKKLGEGRGVTVIADDAEITTQQAAELLGVSRPYLAGLIENGELPARKVGPRHHLLIADVLAYRAETKTKRREALRELAALDQELGLR
jgi:excisionase family DNA binding protein